MFLSHLVITLADMPAEKKSCHKYTTKRMVCGSSFFKNYYEGFATQPCQFSMDLWKSGTK